MGNFGLCVLAMFGPAVVALILIIVKGNDRWKRN